MTSINPFDSSVQCEEVFTVDPEEMAELLAAPAVIARDSEDGTGAR